MNTWTYDSQIYSGASFTDSPSTSTQYIVNANDPISGCVNSDTINVTVYPSPSISVSANPTSITCGESVQLDVTGVGYVPQLLYQKISMALLIHLQLLIILLVVLLKMLHGHLDQMDIVTVILLFIVMTIHNLS